MFNEIETEDNIRTITCGICGKTETGVDEDLYDKWIPEASIVNEEGIIVKDIEEICFTCGCAVDHNPASINELHIDKYREFTRSVFPSNNEGARTRPPVTPVPDNRITEDDLITLHYPSIETAWRKGTEKCS